MSELEPTARRIRKSSKAKPATEEVYFPWRDFEPWLKEGLVCSQILNKLLIASWPIERRPATLEPVATGKEITLLRGIAEQTGNEHWQRRLNNLIEKVVSNSMLYPALNEEAESREVWLALSEHGTSSKLYSNLAPKLERYIEHLKKERPDSIADRMLYVMWNLLGPALGLTLENIPVDSRGATS